MALVKGDESLGVEWPKFVQHEPELHRANMSRLTQRAALRKLARRPHSIPERDDFTAAFSEIAERRAHGKTLMRLHEAVTHDE